MATIKPKATAVKTEPEDDRYDQSGNSAQREHRINEPDERENVPFIFTCTKAGYVKLEPIDCETTARELSPPILIREPSYGGSDESHAVKDAEKQGSAVLSHDCYANTATTNTADTLNKESTSSNEGQTIASSLLYCAICIKESLVKFEGISTMLTHYIIFHGISPAGIELKRSHNDTNLHLDVQESTAVAYNRAKSLDEHGRLIGLLFQKEQELEVPFTLPQVSLCCTECEETSISVYDLVRHRAIRHEGSVSLARNEIRRKNTNTVQEPIGIQTAGKTSSNSSLPLVAGVVSLPKEIETLKSLQQKFASGIAPLGTTFAKGPTTTRGLSPPNQKSKTEVQSIGNVVKLVQPLSSTGAQHVLKVVQQLNSTGAQHIGDVVKVVQPLNSTGAQHIGNVLKVVQPLNSTRAQHIGTVGNVVQPLNRTVTQHIGNVSKVVQPFNSTGAQHIGNVVKVVQPFNSTGTQHIGDVLKVVQPFNSTGTLHIGSVLKVLQSLNSTGAQCIGSVVKVVQPLNSTGTQHIGNVSKVVQPFNSTGAQHIGNVSKVVQPLNSTGAQCIDSVVKVVQPLNSTGTLHIDDVLKVVQPLNSTGAQHIGTVFKVVQPLSTGAQHIGTALKVVQPLNSTGTQHIGNVMKVDQQLGSTGQGIQAKRENTVLAERQPRNLTTKLQCELEPSDVLVRTTPSLDLVQPNIGNENSNPVLRPKTTEPTTVVRCLNPSAESGKTDSKENLASISEHRTENTAKSDQNVSSLQTVENSTEVEQKITKFCNSRDYVMEFEENGSDTTATGPASLGMDENDTARKDFALEVTQSSTDIHLSRPAAPLRTYSRTKPRIVDSRAVSADLRRSFSLFQVTDIAEEVNVDGRRVKKCKLCDCQFNSDVDVAKHFFKQHPNSSDGKSKVTLSMKNELSCTRCNKTFLDVRMLSEHFRVEHCEGTESNQMIPYIMGPKQSVYSSLIIKCGTCMKCFLNMEELHTHVLQVHGQSITKTSNEPTSGDETTADQETNNEIDDRQKMSLTCRACSMSFSSTLYLCNHLREKHLDKTTLPTASAKSVEVRLRKAQHLMTCQKCSMQFQNVQDFISHLVEHRQELEQAATLTCRHCSFKLSDPYSLLVHEQNEHRKGKKPKKILEKNRVRNDQNPKKCSLSAAETPRNDSDNVNLLDKTSDREMALGEISRDENDRMSFTESRKRTRSNSTDDACIDNIIKEEKKEEQTYLTIPLKRIRLEDLHKKYKSPKTKDLILSTGTVAKLDKDFVINKRIGKSNETKTIYEKQETRSNIATDTHSSFLVPVKCKECNILFANAEIMKRHFDFYHDCSSYKMPENFTKRKSQKRQNNQQLQTDSSTENFEAAKDDVFGPLMYNSG